MFIGFSLQLASKHISYAEQNEKLNFVYAFLSLVRFRKLTKELVSFLPLLVCHNMVGYIHMYTSHHSRCILQIAFYILVYLLP